MTRYTNIAIVLHWIMALSFFGILTAGFIMTNADLPVAQKIEIYGMHKSFGFTLFWLAAFRLYWRSKNPPPPLPYTLHTWEKKLSLIVHRSFYVIMFAMPLIGWTIVSSSSLGIPTVIFGMFEFPHIPGLKGNSFIHEAAEIAHLSVALLFIALIILHISATIKHYIFEKENLLKRMWLTKATQ